MKTVTLILLVAALAFAEDAPKTKPESRSSKAASAQSAPQTIPAGAVQVEPYLYRFTDSKGKTWMYRQTPFGVSKWEDKPDAAQPAAAVDDPVSATDLGDSVRFERKTPFGANQWTRKKSELTADEQAILARGKNHAPAPSSAAKPSEKR